MTSASDQNPSRRAHAHIYHKRLFSVDTEVKQTDYCAPSIGSQYLSAFTAAASKFPTQAALSPTDTPRAHHSTCSRPAVMEANLRVALASPVQQWLALLPNIPLTQLLAHVQPSRIVPKWPSVPARPDRFPRLPNYFSAASLKRTLTRPKLRRKARTGSTTSSLWRRLLRMDTAAFSTPCPHTILSRCARRRRFLFPCSRSAPSKARLYGA